MPINTSTLETNLNTKINATSGTTSAKDFLLLGKAIEAITPSVALQDVIDEGATQTTAVQTEGTTQVGLVQTEGTTQVSNVQTEGATQVAAVQAAGTGYIANTNGSFSSGLSGDNITLTGNISGNYTSLHPATSSVVATGTQTLNMNNPWTSVGMTGSTAFSGTNVAAGKTAMVVLDRSASGHTPSFSADIHWADDTEPTWTDHRYWVVSLTCYDSTNIFAAASGHTI